jgi:thiamine pyrophosphate-dependent acetolactate synthase large subunit-like protein
MEIDPPPDYAILASASRAFGITVDKPAELRAALDRAIAEVEGGRAAVVDVRCGLPS